MLDIPLVFQCINPIKEGGMEGGLSTYHPLCL
nr:MAG TPA: hypothetical protein [Herelleviridae sp.]